MARLTTPQHAIRRKSASRGRRPEVEGLEARQLLAVSIAEFPTQLIGGAPTAITNGPDGTIWFTLRGADAIGEIAPSTHAIQVFPGGGGQSMTVGPDGNLWFTDGSSIGTLNTTTHAFAFSSIPSGGQALSITTGADGNLWFTEFPASAQPADTLGEINPTTHAFAEFDVAIEPANGPDTTSNITSGPDGNLWITSFYTDTIDSFDPITHAVAAYPVPYHISDIPQGSGPGGHNGLNAIVVGPDGNLWFTETLANRVGSINPTTHAITEYFLPTASSYPTSITTAGDGNLWVTEAGRQNANLDNSVQFIPAGTSAVASINPTTGAITTYATPSFNANPLGIVAGPGDTIWFAEEQADQIGEAVVTATVGPQITSVARFGYHAMPTTLVLTFDEPLDPSSAQDLANYVIDGPNHRRIRVLAAVYDEITDTVALAPASRLNVHRKYTITINGKAPDGVRAADGSLLDGAGTGQPGSDYHATITWRNLVLRRSVPKRPSVGQSTARPTHTPSRGGAVARVRH